MSSSASPSSGGGGGGTAPLRPTSAGIVMGTSDGGSSQQQQQQLSPADIPYLSVEQLCAAAWPLLPTSLKVPVMGKSLYTAPQPPQSDEPTGVAAPSGTAADGNSASATSGSGSGAVAASPTARGANAGSPEDGNEIGVSVTVTSPTTARGSAAPASTNGGGGGGSSLSLSGVSSTAKAIIEAAMKDEALHGPLNLSIGSLQHVLLRKALAAQLINIQAYNESISHQHHHHHNTNSNSNSVGVGVGGNGNNSASRIRRATAAAAAAAVGGDLDGESSISAGGGDDGVSANVSTSSSSAVTRNTAAASPNAKAAQLGLCASSSSSPSVAEDTLAQMDVRKDKDAVWLHMIALLEGPSGGAATVSPSRSGGAKESALFLDAVEEKDKAAMAAAAANNITPAAVAAANANVAALCAQFSFLIRQIQLRDKSEASTVVGKDLPLLLTAIINVAALSSCNSGAREVLCHIVESLSADFVVGGVVDPLPSPSAHVEVTMTKVITPLLTVLPMVARYWPATLSSVSVDGINATKGASASSSASSLVERLSIALAAMGKKGIFDPRAEVESRNVDVTFFHKVKVERVIDVAGLYRYSNGAGASSTSSSSWSVAADPTQQGFIESIAMPFAKKMSVTFSRLTQPSTAVVKCFHSSDETGTLTHVPLPPEGETVPDLAPGTVAFNILPATGAGTYGGAGGGMGSRFATGSSDYGQRLFGMPDGSAEDAHGDDADAAAAAAANAVPLPPPTQVLSVTVKGEVNVSVDVSWQVAAKKALANALTALSARLLEVGAFSPMQQSEALLPSTTEAGLATNPSSPTFPNASDSAFPAAAGSSVSAQQQASLLLHPQTRRHLLNLCRGGLVSSAMAGVPTAAVPPSSVLSAGMQLLTMEEADFLQRVKCRRSDISRVRAMLAVAVHHLFGFVPIGDIWATDEWRECLRRLMITATTMPKAPSASASSIAAIASASNTSNSAAAAAAVVVSGSASSQSAMNAMDVDFCPSQLSEYIISNVVPLCSTAFRGTMSTASVVDAAVDLVRQQVRAEVVRKVLRQRYHVGMCQLAGLEALEAAIPQWPDRADVRSAVLVLRNYLLLSGSTASVGGEGNATADGSVSSPTAASAAVTGGGGTAPARATVGHYLNGVLGCGEATEGIIRVKVHGLIVKVFSVVRVLKRQLDRAVARRQNTAAHRYLKSETREGGIILSALSLLACPLDRLDLAAMCKGADGSSASSSASVTTTTNGNRDVFDNFSELLPVFSDFSRSASFTVSSLEDERGASATLANFMDLWQQRIGSKNTFNANSQRASKVSLELPFISETDSRRSGASGGRTPLVTVAPIAGGKRLMGYVEIKYQSAPNNHIRVGLVATNDAKHATTAENSTIRYSSVGKMIVPAGSCAEYPSDGSSPTKAAPAAAGPTGPSASFAPRPPAAAQQIVTTVPVLPCGQSRDTLSICVVANGCNEHVVEYAVNGVAVFRYTTTAATAKFLAVYCTNGVLGLTVRFDGSFERNLVYRHPCAFASPSPHYLSVVALSTLNLLMRRCSPVGDAGGKDAAASSSAIAASTLFSSSTLGVQQMHSIQSLLTRGEEALADMLANVLESVKGLPSKALGDNPQNAHDISTTIKVGAADTIYSNILHQLLCCAKVTMAGFFYLQTQAAAAAAEAAASGDDDSLPPSSPLTANTPSVPQFGASCDGGASDASKFELLQKVIGIAASLQPARLVPVLVKVLTDVPEDRRDIIAVASTILATAVEFGYVVHDEGGDGGASNKAIIDINDNDSDNAATASVGSGAAHATHNSVNAIVRLSAESVEKVLRKLYDAGTDAGGNAAPDGCCSPDSGLPSRGPSFVASYSGSQQQHNSSPRSSRHHNSSSHNASPYASKILAENPSMAYSDDGTAVVEMGPRVAVSSFNKELARLLKKVGANANKAGGDEASSHPLEDTTPGESPVDEAHPQMPPSIRATSSKMSKGTVATYSVRFSTDGEFEKDRDLFGIGFATVEGFQRISANPRDALRIIRQNPGDFFVLNNIDKRGSGGGAQQQQQQQQGYGQPPPPPMFNFGGGGGDAILQALFQQAQPAPVQQPTAPPTMGGVDTSNMAAYDVAEQRLHRCNWHQQEKCVVYTDGEQITVEYDSNRRTISFFRNGMPLGKLYRNVGKGLGESYTQPPPLAAAAADAPSSAASPSGAAARRTLFGDDDDARGSMSDHDHDYDDDDDYTDMEEGDEEHPELPVEEEMEEAAGDDEDDEALAAIAAAEAAAAAEEEENINNLSAIRDPSPEAPTAPQAAVSETKKNDDCAVEDEDEAAFQLVPFIVLYERQCIAVVQQPLLSPYYLRAQRLAKALLRSAPSAIISRALGSAQMRLFMMQVLGADGDGKSLIRWVRTEKIVSHGLQSDREALSEALQGARGQLELLLQLAQQGGGGGADPRQLLASLNNARGRGGGANGATETRTIAISRRLVKLNQLIDDTSEVYVTNTDGASSSSSAGGAAAEEQTRRISKVPLALLSPDVNTCSDNTQWLSSPAVFRALVEILTTNVASAGDGKVTLFNPAETIRALRLVFDVLVGEDFNSSNDAIATANTNTAAAALNATTTTATGPAGVAAAATTASAESDDAAANSGSPADKFSVHAALVKELLASLPEDLFAQFFAVLRLLTSIQFNTHETEMVSLLMREVNVQRIQTWKVLGTLGPHWTSSCRARQVYGPIDDIPERRAAAAREALVSATTAGTLQAMMGTPTGSGAANDFIFSAFRNFEASASGVFGGDVNASTNNAVNASQAVSIGDVSVIGGADDSVVVGAATEGSIAAAAVPTSADGMASRAVNALRCCRCNECPWGPSSATTGCDHRLPANDLELLCGITRHISSSTADDDSAAPPADYVPLITSGWSSANFGIKFTSADAKEGTVSGSGSDSRGDFTFTGKVIGEYGVELRLRYAFEPIAPSADDGNDNDNAGADASGGGNNSAEWACEACTFLNPDEVRQCQICNTSRPGMSWQCPRCTYAHNANDAPRCEACGHAAPNRNGDGDDEDEREPYTSVCVKCKTNKRSFAHPARFQKMSYCSTCEDAEAEFIFTEEYRATLKLAVTPQGDQLTGRLFLAGSTENLRIQKDGPSVAELTERVRKAGLSTHNYLRIPSEVLKQQSGGGGGHNPFIRSRGGSNFVGIATVYMASRVFTKCIPQLFAAAENTNNTINHNTNSTVFVPTAVSTPLSPTGKGPLALPSLLMRSPALEVASVVSLVTMNEELFFEGIFSQLTPAQHEAVVDALCAITIPDITKISSAMGGAALSSPTKSPARGGGDSSSSLHPSPSTGTVMLPTARAFAALSLRAVGPSRDKVLYGIVWAALRGVWSTTARDDIRSLLVNNVSIVVDRVGDREGANLSIATAAFYCAPSKAATTQRLGLLLAIRSHDPSLVRQEPTLSALFVAHESYARMLQNEKILSAAATSSKNTKKEAPPALRHMPRVLRDNVFARAPTCVQLTGSQMTNGLLDHGQARGSVGVNVRDKGQHYYEIVIPEDFAMRGRSAVAIGWGTRNHELQGANTHVGLTNDSAGFDPSAQEVRMMGGQTQYVTPRPVVVGDVIGAMLDLKSGQMCWTLNGEEIEWISSAFGPTDVLYPYVSRNSGAAPLEIRLGNTEYTPEGYSDFSATLMTSECLGDDAEVPPKPLSFYTDLSSWVNELTNSGISMERVLECGGSWVPQGLSALSRFDSLKEAVSAFNTVSAGASITSPSASVSAAAAVAAVSPSSSAAAEVPPSSRLIALRPYVHQLIGFSNLIVVAGGAPESITRHYAGVKAQINAIRKMMLASARAAAIDQILSMTLERDGNLTFEITIDRDRAKDAINSGNTSSILSHSITGQFFEAIRSRNVYRRRNMFTVKLADVSGKMAQDYGGVYRSMITAMSAELMFTREAGSSDRHAPVVPLFKCNDHSSRFAVVPNPDILHSLHRDKAQQMFIWLGRMFGNAVMAGTTLYAISFPILVWKKLLGHQSVSIEEYYVDCNDSAKGSLADEEFLLSDDYLYSFPNIERHYHGPTDVQQYLATHGGLGVLASAGAVGVGSSAVGTASGAGAAAALVLMATPVSQAVGGFPRVNSQVFDVIGRTASNYDLTAAGGGGGGMGQPSGSTAAIATALAAKRDRLVAEVVKSRREAAVRSLLTEYDEGIALMKKGMESVVPQEALRELTWEDLRRRVTGSVALTGEDILSNCEFEGCPEDVKDMFKAAVLTLTPEMCGKLLQYCTGQERLPVPEPIKISVGDRPTHLPSAHTCSPISLTVQKYESVEKMAEMIARAVAHTGEFGLV